MNITTASEIFVKCQGRDNSTFAALVRSEHLGDDSIDQDWESESTTYTFADGSKLRASGGWVEELDCETEADK